MEMSTTETAQELEKTLTDPRYLRGILLLKEKRLEEAVVIFADLLRVMCDVEGKGETLAVAPVYYEYGHALLSLTEATASLFGGAVERNETSDEGAVEKDARETADDLEAAWEVMELARVIYSRYPGDLAVEAQLVRVYTRLGDLGLESDQFEQAKSDFEKALLLRRKLLKATKAKDTTQLADLYCQLAIACIYRDSTEDKDKNVTPYEELTHYVMAGRVMAENIHRLAKKCNDKLQEFVKNVPMYSVDEDVECQGKRTRNTAELTLLYDGKHPETMKSEFLQCIEITDDKGPIEKDTKTLLEYMEIYLELKEKVDTINETIAELKTKEEQSVSTCGFNQTDSIAANTAVNVVPVVKKQKRASTPDKETATATNDK